MRVATHQFVMGGARNIGQAEPAFLLGDCGVKFNLIQQVAKLFDECVVGGGVVGVECVQRINHFVCFFNQVPNK